MIQLNAHSAFHLGEQDVQSRLAVQEKIAPIGQKFIRDFMPEQHMQFYQQLDYIFLGSVDKNNRPWASIAFNTQAHDYNDSAQHKLIQTPNNKTLTLNAEFVQNDPLNALELHDSVGVLGLELATKRRNRLSATISARQPKQLQLTVKQTFGNCPKYITPRDIRLLTNQQNRPTTTVAINKLDKLALELVEQSDMFLVASYYKHNAIKDKKAYGVDVSHRGGPAGFIRIDTPNKLTIPDYSGNNFFNTLGNISATGKAGLLFIDLKNGHLLSLTGQAQILWDSPSVSEFPQAHRLWQFELESGYWFFNALPFTFQQIK